MSSRQGSSVRYWWINQNQTNRQEIEGGYLWSPEGKIDGAGRCGEHGHDKLLLRTLPGPRADCVRLRHQTIRVSHGCEPTALTVINAVFIQCKA